MVISGETVLPNPLFDPTWRASGHVSDAIAVHRKLPGYAPSPLVDLPTVAADLGVDHVWLKDESHRMGLPAFKILGASWAVIATIQEMLGIDVDDWQTIDDLRDRCEPLRPLTLACATDGNHGRAVARMAKWLGFGAIILVPNDMAPARIEAIQSEGAEIRIIAGSYDDAIDASSALASDRRLVISDTAWPGYDQIPRRVIEGYSTILVEAQQQLTDRDAAEIDLVAVPIGVGALAAAVVNHLRATDSAVQIVGVEPIRADCMLESVRAGHPVQIPGPHTSIMSGLNCGIPSPLAWPIVSRGINTFTAVSDERDRDAVRLLAEAGVIAGECGAAGLAGLTLLREQGCIPERVRSVLLLSTEGATDRTAWTRTVGADLARELLRGGA